MKLLILLLLTSCVTQQTPIVEPEPIITKEPFDIEDGCNSIGSCSLTNNRNKFDFSKTKNEVTCSNEPCPDGMKRVCDEKYKTNLCVDIILVSQNNIPEGNYSYYNCKDLCESQGKRILTNNEWLVAINGTRQEDCRAPGPKDRKLGSPTQDGPDYNSSKDMTNLKFNEAGFRQDRTQCISTHQIKDGIGVLGQWVSDPIQFNGGLWAFPSASTVFYRTSAHGPSYYDYSIGCRCGK